jgi:aminoglycoside phosphotransferase
MINHEKWVELFRKMIKNPQDIEILQIIDLGYLSDVYLLSIDGIQYAVKMYHDRYSGSNIYLKERQHIMRARKSIPAAVPQALFCSDHADNAFHREILIMKRALGVPLSKDVFDEHVFEVLVAILRQLHSTQAPVKPTTNEIERLDTCSRTMIQFLKENEVIPRNRVISHLSALREYYIKNQPIFNLQHTIIHGDLWWDNILVDNGNVTIVDWLDSSEQDYCRDLAQFKIGTLNEILNPKESQIFFEKIVKTYVKSFNDDTINERLRYYLPLMYLEEAFYLPFKFFPWEMKYNEDNQNFEKRLLDYYDRSERTFRNVLTS